MAATAGLVVETGPLESPAGAARIALAGKSDPHSAKRLRDTIGGLLERGTKALLLDCARLEYLNSTALGYLINLADHVKKSGGSLAFLRVSQKVRMVFDLLGLKDFFPFFEREDEARRFLAAPAEEPEEEPPASAPEPKGEPETEPEGVIAALPAWLEAVDAPAPPPLEPLRWNVVLQALAIRVNSDPIEKLCRKLQVPTGAGLALTLRQLLKKYRTPEDLLAEFDEASIDGLCRLYGIPLPGARDVKVGRLIAKVRESSTETLSEPLREEEPSGPLEPTLENLLQALQKSALPKRLKSEPAAKQIIARSLAARFGADKVRTKRNVGKHTPSEVDVELSETFGVFVRLAPRVLAPTPAAAKEAQRFLGQVVLAGHHYKPEDVVAVVVGEPPPGADVEEIAEGLEGLGARFIHLRG